MEKVNKWFTVYFQEFRLDSIRVGSFVCFQVSGSCFYFRAKRGRTWVCRGYGEAVENCWIWVDE